MHKGTWYRAVLAWGCTEAYAGAAAVASARLMRVVRMQGNLRSSEFMLSFDYDLDYHLGRQ